MKDNLDRAIDWFMDRKGKVTYSMNSRRGPTSYDCSSAIYYALIQAGIFPEGIYIGNTESLFNDLERHDWKILPESPGGFIDARKGDIFIWGRRGASSGAFGHTGIFVDANNIIHCSLGYNGIAVSNHDWLWGLNGQPANTIYRYTGSANPPVINDPTDQVVEVGSFIKFPETYRADEVMNIADVWQVRTATLCPVGFTWADNGIPAGPLVEVATDGYKTSDQELDIGSFYKIPGKFEVFDVGESSGRWLALIKMAGMDVWVDLEAAVEVGSNDPGTPTPQDRPPAPPAPKPEPTPEPIPEPTPPPVDYPKENHDLLKQILAILQSILNKINGVFK